MIARPRLAFLTLLLVTGFVAMETPLLADEVEIVRFLPASPASLDGIAAWPAGSPMPALTTGNSVTVIVRYRTDGPVTDIQAFPEIPTGSTSAGFRVAASDAGGVPACGPVSAASAGECATAFYLHCDGSTASPISIDRVAVSLRRPDGTASATDREPASYTFRCEPPRRGSPPCRVTGVPGVPGAAELPFTVETPICRCLQDRAAREFRCALLHPDFFVHRRMPFPVPAGQPFSETWEFLPLTTLAGPVTMSLSDGGRARPVRHTFRQGRRRQSGSVERFVTEGKMSQGSSSVAGTATFEFTTTGGGNRKFAIEWRLDEREPEAR